MDVQSVNNIVNKGKGEIVYYGTFAQALRRKAMYE